MADPTDSGIYEIVNLTNGKRYVGSAVNLSRRRVEHFTQLRHGKHINRHLQASFSRHGEENFRFEVLERCDPEQLIASEQRAIDERRPEYNICRRAGSSLGVKRTPEQRAALSARMKGSIISAEHRAKLSAALKGRVFDPEHLERIASALAAKRAAGWRPSREAIERGAAKRRGRKATAETRAKQSAARKGKASPLKGRSHSPETRQRMSERQRANPTFKGKKHTAETRAKLSEIAKRRAYSAEARAKMSQARRGRRLSPEHVAKLCGRKHSAEAKAKMSAAQKGRTFSAESRARMSESQRRKAPPTAETRAKMSASRQGSRNGATITTPISIVNLGGEVISGIPMELRKRTGISPASMTQLIRGQQKTSKGWRLLAI